LSSDTTFSIPATGPRTVVMSTDDTLTSELLSLSWSRDASVKQVGHAFLLNVTIRSCPIFRSTGGWTKLLDIVTDVLGEWLGMEELEASLSPSRIFSLATPGSEWAEIVVVELEVISAASAAAKSTFGAVKMVSDRYVDDVTTNLTKSFEKATNEQSLVLSVFVHMGSPPETVEVEDSTEEAGFWESTVVRVILASMSSLCICLLAGGSIKMAYDRYKKADIAPNTNPV